jgi:hypothetical protein
METNIEQTPITMPTRETSWGSIVGIIVVIVILLIGSLYFWGKEISNNGTLPSVDENITAEDILAQPDTIIKTLKNQSTSDDIASIKTDLNATDLSGLNNGLNNIDAELNN